LGSIRCCGLVAVADQSEEVKVLSSAWLWVGCESAKGDCEVG
jgi:hypothetical protein